MTLGAAPLQDRGNVMREVDGALAPAAEGFCVIRSGRDVETNARSVERDHSNESEAAVQECPARGHRQPNFRQRSQVKKP
jgi:hypothetical protein